jgi:hypothetical protein
VVAVDAGHCDHGAAHAHADAEGDDAGIEWRGGLSSVDGDVPETRAITVDACATGAPQVFITGFTETTKKAGSQMLVNYQLASDFPIIRTVVKVDGVVVQDSGLGREVRLQVYGSMWFTAPAIGTHAVSVAVTNLSTCVREAASPVPLRIKQ